MVSERERLQGIRLFLAMSILFLVGAFGINMYQAHQSGTGYGWGDTREAQYTDHQRLIPLAQTPTSDRIPGARGFANEAVRIVGWLVLMGLVLVFWHVMLSRLGTFEMKLIDDSIIDGDSVRRVHVWLTYIAAAFTVLVVLEGVAMFFLFVLHFGWVK